MTTTTIQGLNLSVAFTNANTLEEFITAYRVVSHGEGTYSDKQLEWIYDVLCDFTSNSLR